MPDGKRKRRFSANRLKRKWYALYRSLRFRRRFIEQSEQDLSVRATWVRTQLAVQPSRII
jgi:hypothetical protein